MIKEFFELYCDNCETFIAKIKYIREQRDYIHAEGFIRHGVNVISFTVFCSEKCKRGYYYDMLEVDEIIEEI